MQNNSGDLCLLIGIYSFILFYLLCVRDLFFHHFLPLIFWCVCVRALTLYTGDLYIYIDRNVCRCRDAINEKKKKNVRYSQFIRTTIINIISNTHTLSIIQVYVSRFFRLTK